MKKILISLLAGTIALTGCHRSHKPKPNPAVATEVELEFMQRWVDQRAHDYITHGKFATKAEANAQATADFYQQYPDTTLAEKAGVAAPGLK
jgi:outer membrane biogenesis lipoprotein LolB